MSKEVKVWADGFGDWHAFVEYGNEWDSIIAHAAIASALLDGGEVSEGDIDEAMHVLHIVTTREGAEFVEEWRWPNE